MVTLVVSIGKRYYHRVIRSFRGGKGAEAIWHRRYVKKLSPELAKLTYNKLALINAARASTTCVCLQATGWRSCPVIAPVSTASE